MNSQPRSVLVPDIKTFRGNWLLYRKDGKQLLSRTGGRAPARPPKFRHLTMASAITEANRLLVLYPQSTFVILQEVARARLKPADLQSPQIAVMEIATADASGEDQ